MLNETFRIDWVFIDSVVITLLLILLISVRIFKSTHRWRSSFSNEAIERLLLPYVIESVKKQTFFIKKCFLTRKSFSGDNKNMKPLIFILRTNYKRKLLTILTEGLCSYGFDVITLRIKMERHLSQNNFEKFVSNEVNSLIFSIIEIYRKITQTDNQQYILLSHSRSKVPYKIFGDEKNMGMILINPKVTERKAKSLYEFFINSHKKFYLFIIFSRKSILLFKNKNINQMLKELHSTKFDKKKIIILDKSKNSFKYYETIILGMIIDIVENKLMTLDV